MGLGGGRSEWEEYEWIRLADLPVPAATLAAPTEAVSAWLQTVALWVDVPGPRLLLVDLDNLRADPLRWRYRMTAVVLLARMADHAVMAGQRGAVERARPHLAEYAGRAHLVPDGSDLADHVLLDAAAELRARVAQVLVMSNDGIFAELAELAERTPLVVLSPGRDALSDRLRDAATRVEDLASLDAAVVPRDPALGARPASRARARRVRDPTPTTSSGRRPRSPVRG